MAHGLRTDAEVIGSSRIRSGFELGAGMLEDVASAMPVIGALRDAETLTGFWHFQDMVPGTTHSCDDHRGIFYEQAGPRNVPDAVDVGLVALSNFPFLGLTLNYPESTGPAVKTGVSKSRAVPIWSIYNSVTNSWLIAAIRWHAGRP
jgi:hypothetical protein